MLPDDVLLEIFDFYVDEDLEDESYKKDIEKWQRLVHVCHRWRSVVFRSPRRLNLQLLWTPGTPARGTLDVWPSLPILIPDYGSPTEDVDDILAVLERSDRVVEINFYTRRDSELEDVLAAMQVPFPELTDLQLSSRDGMVSSLPDSFLGGSVPRLQSLSLSRIPFPGLLKLLLSAPHLVHLRLFNIPHSGYFSPEAIVAVLSTLTSLEGLGLVFESPLSRPDWAHRRLPPPTRSVLPVLTSFSFTGVCEYLEDIMTCISAPQLDRLSITLFNQIVFETLQFIQFISRSPISETFENAAVVFSKNGAMVRLSSQTSGYKSGHVTLEMSILCIELDWQVSSMEQVCTSCLPPLSMLEDLYIYESPSQPVWKDNIENTLWLELLQPFTSVKNLYLSEEFALRIVPALRELVGAGTTEVLPTLQNIFLEELQSSGTVQEDIQQFVATRQVTGHPIAVFRWDRDRNRFMY